MLLDPNCECFIVKKFDYELNSNTKFLPFTFIGGRIFLSAHRNLEMCLVSSAVDTVTFNVYYTYDICMYSVYGTIMPIRFCATNNVGMIYGSIMFHLKTQ